jgi:hypothetical protein
MTFLPTLLNTLYFSVGVLILNNIPWKIIFLLTKPYGIRLYTLSKKEECKKIQKKIGTNSSQLSDNNKGSGYSFGYWYLIHIEIITSDDNDSYKIILIATESSYKNLVSDDNETCNNTKLFDDVFIPDQIKKNISIWESFGSYHNRWYRKRTIKIPDFNPFSYQLGIMEQITDHYKKYKHTTAFLHGPPGSGKSKIGLLLTNHYSSSYCKCLKLWKPGETLSSLHSEVDPTEDKPLIILLNEIDIPLVQITNGIENHKHLDISIQDKSGWNNLFDDVHIGIYPNVIILLTSNKSPTFINELDPSYLRDGRIDFIFEVNSS